MRCTPALSGLALVASLTACALRGTITPATAQRMSSVEAQLASAQQIGADDEPRAAAHARLAREELTAAQQRARGGDGRAAARLVDQATLDAALAIALTREATARRDAEDTRARIAALEARTTPAASAPSPSASDLPPAPPPPAPPPPAAPPPVPQPVTPPATPEVTP